jgi:hypothetical protein
VVSSGVGEEGGGILTGYFVGIASLNSSDDVYVGPIYPHLGMFSLKRDSGGAHLRTSIQG